MNEIIENYDRVTDVIKPFSGIDSIPLDVLNEAAERGKNVHDEILSIHNELWIPGSNKTTQGYITSYLSWAQEKKFVEKLERLYEKDLKITGEIDAIYEMGESGLCLVDFKTTARKYGKQLEKFKLFWGMQLAAYAHLLKCCGIEVQKIELVQLDKEGEKARVYDLTSECSENWRIFIQCLETYRSFFKERKSQGIDLDYL